MPLGLPMPMFLVFAATVVAGSLGAIHYVIVHVLMGRPFAEVPPPILEKRGPRSMEGGRGREAGGPADGSGGGGRPGAGGG